MKRLIIILAAVALVTAVGTSTVQAKPNEQPHFKLPANAKLQPDGSYSLGTKKDPTTGKQVEGFAYLHPKAEAAKSSSSSQAARGTVCYALLSSGMRWKTAEPWVLDPTNTQGLASDFLLSHTASNLGKWESAASYNIFGNGALGSGLSVDMNTVDGQNEVMFGSIEEPGVIAVTIVWGYYSGPTRFREIVEWDQMFDQQDFAWSATGETGKMDFDNISTHEVGHAAGMGHPASTCTEETMYAYADYGETKKRDLNTGDIAGIRTLY